MKKRYTPEQIVGKLCQADVELGKGQTVLQSCQQIGVSEQTCYRRRQKYDCMSPDMAKQLNASEKGNARPKRLVANQALDIQLPKEASRPNL
jgi:putative transposase